MHEPIFKEEADCAGTAAEGQAGFLRFPEGCANPEHTLEMDTHRCVPQGVSYRESHTYSDSITIRCSLSFPPTLVGCRVCGPS